MANQESTTLNVCRSYVAASGGELALNADPIFVQATSPDSKRKVALVSGGGAGHEPLHIGFVGRGGLDAVCPGEVFTSPHSRQIYQAGKAAALDGGVVQIVKNYTGDVINFAIAAERLAAEGIEVGTVLVNEDIGTDSGAATGMRGTAVTMIVEKVLGAAADDGLALADLVELGEQIVNDSRSVAVAFASHTDRETGEAVFEVDANSFEYGVGIHGERANSQIDAEPIPKLAQRMVADLLQANPAKAPMIVLVNGLGGLSNLELAAISTQIIKALNEAEVEIESLTFGTYVSALDMRGFSVTLVNSSPDWLPYWYKPHQTRLPQPRKFSETEPIRSETKHHQHLSSAWAVELAKKLVAMRPAFNKLDSKAGDGDFGDNFALGLNRAIDDEAGTKNVALADDLTALSQAFLDDIGGSSGPLIGLLLQAAAESVAEADDEAEALAKGLADGARAVSRVGGAELGDRTMIDALKGFVEADSQAVNHDTAPQALADAKQTAQMRPKRGRATYLADRVKNVPDAGALAIAALVIGLSEQLTGEDHSTLWDDLVETLNS